MAVWLTEACHLYQNQFSLRSGITDGPEPAALEAQKREYVPVLLSDAMQRLEEDIQLYEGE